MSNHSEAIPALSAKNRPGQPLKPRGIDSMSQPNPDLAPIAVSVRDAAKMTSLAEITVGNLIRSGELPARRYGRRTLILVDELQAYLRNLELVSA